MHFGEGWFRGRSNKHLRIQLSIERRQVSLKVKRSIQTSGGRKSELLGNHFPICPRREFRNFSTLCLLLVPLYLDTKRPKASASRVRHGLTRRSETHSMCQVGFFCGEQRMS